jgi:gliding motility-associated-like protein
MKPHFVSLIKSIAICCAFLCTTIAFGQQNNRNVQACNGSVGDPLVHIDFGSGVGFGPALPAGTTTLLGYQGLSCPTDGGYNIMNSTPACWAGDWHAVNGDHTGNPNGYFMMVNAAIPPSDFYIKTIPGLCADTDYQVSFSILNIHKYGILPNITVIVEDLGGVALSSYNTGPIPLSATPTWNTYAMVANVATNTSVRIRLRNNAPGGIGNDLCLDDIIFRPIGPAISLDITGFTGGVANITTADLGNLELTSIVGSCYTNNVLQWQVSTDNGSTWTDIAGASNTNYFRSPTGVGTYLYRLVVSPLISGGNPNCKVNSSPITVNVATPSGCVAFPTTTTTQSCSTGTATIAVTSPLGANFLYSINGVTYQASPTFTSVAAGNYNVTYQNTTLGCTSPANPVVITPVVQPAGPVVTSPVYYCQNSTATALSATALPGHTLNWYGTNASGGTASPTPTVPSTATVGTATYYVAQTNGTCESPRVPIVVNVSAPGSPQAAANPFCDNGNTTPTNVAFDWSNVPGYIGYNYSYSIGGGPLVYGSQASPSHINIPVAGPGTSVTFTIISVIGVPCAPSQTVTCHSTCLVTTTPTFNPIATSYCVGAAAPALPTTSTNGITGIWSPTTINTAAAGTANYLFTPDQILFPCAAPVTLNITVKALVTPTFAAIPATICQNAVFALPTTSTNSPAITGTWSPALNTAVLGSNTYTFIPTAGQCTTPGAVTATINVIPNVTPNFAVIPPICSGTTPIPTLATISPNGITGTWSPAIISNTTSGNYTFTPNPNQCATTQVLNVTVNPLLIPNFAAIAPICSGATPIPALATTSPNGITGTWSPAVISNTTSGAYTFTPNAPQCASQQVLNVTVNPRITPTFAGIAPICQNSASPVLPTSSNNVPPVTGTWSPAVSTATVGTTIYTFTPTAGQCTAAILTTLSITVVQPQVPNFGLIPPFCADTVAPTLATTSPNGVEGTWSPAIVSNTASGTYTFTPNANQCATTQVLNITVTPRTIPNFAQITPFCNGEVAPILNPTSPNGVNGTWNPATISNTASGQYVFTPDAGECATTQTLSVTVNQPLVPDFANIEFCSGTTPPALQLVSPNGVNGTWTPAVIDNLVSGSYDFLPDTGECAVLQTIFVTVNDPTLQSVTWSVSAAFDENQVITVLASGPGDYLYQLDFGPFQESPVFENVLAGTHTITVVDQNGCSPSITESDVMVINYPKYFTPNGDGFHDTWNVTGLEDQPGKISIFDRYGKLIKQISTMGKGWDGTYNGRQLPSTDYWFTIEYNELSAKKEFKAHFALKR